MLRSILQCCIVPDFVRQFWFQIQFQLPQNEIVSKIYKKYLLCFQSIEISKKLFPAFDIILRCTRPDQLSKPLTFYATSLTPTRKASKLKFVCFQLLNCVQYVIGAALGKLSTLKQNYAKKVQKISREIIKILFATWSSLLPNYMH